MLRVLSGGPLTIGELARAMGLRRSSVRDTCGILRDRGLVRIDADNRYHITDTGEDTLLSTAVSLSGFTTGVQVTPEERAERDRDLHAVLDYAAAADLEPNETEFLLRREFPDGMTESEIGRFLGISRQAVEQIVYRAKRKLGRSRTLRELVRD